MKQLWGYFKEVFLESEETEVEVKKERKLFSRALLKIEEIYESNTTMKELINSTQITQRFLEFLAKNFNHQESQGVLILLMDSLCQFIHNAEEEDGEEESEKKEEQ